MKDYDVKSLTKKHLRIVENFVNATKEFASIILLTGSTAWGAYHAITPSSDIDLVVIYSDAATLQKIIQKYIDTRLVPFTENERFEKFKEIQNKYKVCQFSLIVVHENIPVSIDFISEDAIKMICNMEPLNQNKLRSDSLDIDIRTIKEFRSNRPRISGYTLDDLGSTNKIIYSPKYTEVKSKDDRGLGYLSETLIDGQATDKDSKKYYLGVISFFLTISPKILSDRNGKLQILIDLFRSKIAQIISGKTVNNITRQERMTEETIKKIKESFR
jgi:predicted nucleotidyltransferase